MTSLGYALSSEEHGPLALAGNARLAEEAGFEFALISDHFHPWTSRQGESPFVWAVLGAIAVQTTRLRVGTGVTCPTFRLHPALVAQAAATCAVMYGDRFFLGVGAGENLNEHVVGVRWPAPAERLDRLREAIGILRELWSGAVVTCRGRYYTVDEARLHTCPATPPPVYVAASGPVAAALAGELGDGFVGTAPDRDLIGAFRAAGGDKPALGQLTVCYGRTEAAARRTVRDWWPQTGLAGDLSWELKTPELVEAACEPLSEDDVVRNIPCGPDPEVHLQAIRAYMDAGFSAVYLHQVGPDQSGFIRFFRDELRDRL